MEHGAACLPRLETTLLWHLLTDHLFLLTFSVCLGLSVAVPSTMVIVTGMALLFCFVLEPHQVVHRGNSWLCT